MHTNIIVALIAAGAAIITSVIALYQANSSNRKSEKAQHKIQFLQKRFSEELEVLKSNLLVNQHKRIEGVSVFSEERKKKMNAIKEAIESLQLVKDNIINMALKSLPGSLKRDTFTGIIRETSESLVHVYSSNMAHLSAAQKNIIHHAKKETESLKLILADPSCYQDDYFLLTKETETKLQHVKTEFSEIQNKLRTIRDEIINQAYEESTVD